MASLAVGWVIAGRVLAPIAHITSVAREIQARELSRRIELDGPDDELKRLADTFDSMLARLDLAFASQRRFVADASHELRTPLAIIKANLDLALTDAEATDESRATAAAVIKRAIDRMARLTDDLLALARLDAPASGREPVPLAALLEDAREEFAAAAAARAVELETAVVPGRIVQGDRDVLKRAVTNLLDNAVRVAPGGVERPALARRGRRLGLARRRGRRPRDRARAPGVDLRPLLARRRRRARARAAAAASGSRSCGRSRRRIAARSTSTPTPARGRRSSSGCRGRPDPGEAPAVDPTGGRRARRWQRD